MLLVQKDISANHYRGDISMNKCENVTSVTKINTFLSLMSLGKCY